MLLVFLGLIPFFNLDSFPSDPGKSHGFERYLFPDNLPNRISDYPNHVPGHILSSSTWGIIRQTYSPKQNFWFLQTPF